MSLRDRGGRRSVPSVQSILKEARQEAHRGRRGREGPRRKVAYAPSVSGAPQSAIPQLSGSTSSPSSLSSPSSPSPLSVISPNPFIAFSASPPPPAAPIAPMAVKSPSSVASKRGATKPQVLRAEEEVAPLVNSGALFELEAGQTSIFFPSQEEQAEYMNVFNYGHPSDGVGKGRQRGGGMSGEESVEEDLRVANMYLEGEGEEGREDESEEELAATVPMPGGNHWDRLQSVGTAAEPAPTMQPAQPLQRGLPVTEESPSRGTDSGVDEVVDALFIIHGNGQDAMSLSSSKLWSLVCDKEALKEMGRAGQVLGEKSPREVKRAFGISEREGERVSKAQLRKALVELNGGTEFA